MRGDQNEWHIGDSIYRGRQNEWYIEGTTQKETSVKLVVLQTGIRMSGTMVVLLKEDQNVAH
jgi:chromosome segregation ATPase